MEPEVHDHGPMYHETFSGGEFIIEPWNAFSSLFFLVPVIFWIIKLRGKYRQFPMIALLLPLLFMNGIGSTIYHAFRASNFALLLDWMPAFIMNLILSWYMWKKVLHRNILPIFVVLAFYATAVFIIASFAPILGDLAANLGYLCIGLSILTPSVIFLIRTRFYKGHLLILTFVFLGISLLFRSLDFPTENPFPNLLPQGTHFLWHIVSAFAVFTLGFYFMHIQGLDSRTFVKSERNREERKKGAEWAKDL